MSDHVRHVTLPPRRKPPPLFTNGFVLDPEQYQLKLVGELRIDARRLIVFQDELSKQVFWTEYDEADLPYPHIPLHGYNWDDRECGRAGDLYLLDQRKFEQFKHFVLGWAVEYFYYDLAERQELIKAVEAALASAPEYWP